MRALALGLLLTSGCNQIFGLHGDLVSRDAPFVDFQDAMSWPMKLTWQLVADPSGAITYPVIDGATVQVGPIDPAAGPLVTVPIDATGTFLVPHELPNQVYRLVYTGDAVPTEIQSQLNSAHFVVPMVGRLDRQPTPSHALLEFDPNHPGILPQARIFTVGLWTSAYYPNGDQINLPYTYDYQANAISLSGPQGSLVGGNPHADVEILCAFDASGDVTGFARMSVDKLYENGQGISTAPSIWSAPFPNASVRWLTPNEIGPNSPVARLTAAVNMYGSPTQLEWAGVIPSPAIASFIQPIAGGLDLAQVLPLSTNASVSPHLFVNPFIAADLLPLAAYVQNTTARTIASGATLTSGFQAVGLAPTPATIADVRYAVGIAHQANNDVTLKPEGGPSVTMTGADDTIVVHVAGAALVDLSFGTDQPVDDCVATLYKISGTTVTPVRRLLLQQPPTKLAPFKIDASIFMPATTYTFGVVCRKGQPGVASGDYTMVSYPYMTSTLYTPTFTVAQ